MSIKYINFWGDYLAYKQINTYMYTNVVAISIGKGGGKINMIDKNMQKLFLSLVMRTDAIAECTLVNTCQNVWNQLQLSSQRNGVYCKRHSLLPQVKLSSL